MISGKPVTVQMAGGGNKTLTFVQQQPGKILRLPTTGSVTSTGVSLDQPKLVVVPRQKQPSTIASTSFDSPATTDAALAALAAEAGLIDPEPSKDNLSDMTPDEEENHNTSLDTENEKDGEVETEVSATGLFGGSSSYSKLSLKGGSKFRLGLFGGSPINSSINPPTKPFTYRGGLLGGGKDSPDTSQDSSVTPDSGNQSLTSVNGSVRTVKSEDGCDTDDMKMDLDQESSKTDCSFSTDSGKMDTTPEQTDNNNVLDCDKNKKEETSDDALSALASAALDHSKDSIKTENTTAGQKDPKDAWYTVGFIKGTSCDVRNYFLLDEDSNNFIEDSLPDISHLPRISLEPGTAYKFRVAALNSVGRGEWSEVLLLFYVIYKRIEPKIFRLRHLKRACPDFQVPHLPLEFQKLWMVHICLGSLLVQVRVIY